MQTGNVGSSEPSELGEFDMKVEVEAGVFAMARDSVEKEATCPAASTPATSSTAAASEAGETTSSESKPKELCTVIGCTDKKKNNMYCEDHRSAWDSLYKRAKKAQNPDGESDNHGEEWIDYKRVFGFKGSKTEVAVPKDLKVSSQVLIDFCAKFPKNKATKGNVRGNITLASYTKTEGTVTVRQLRKDDRVMDKNFFDTFMVSKRRWNQTRCDEEWNSLDADKQRWRAYDGPLDSKLQLAIPAWMHCGTHLEDLNQHQSAKMWQTSSKPSTKVTQEEEEAIKKELFRGQTLQPATAADWDNLQSMRTAQSHAHDVTAPTRGDLMDAAMAFVHKTAQEAGPRIAEGDGSKAPEKKTSATSLDGVPDREKIDGADRNFAVRKMRTEVDKEVRATEDAVRFCLQQLMLADRGEDQDEIACATERAHVANLFMAKKVVMETYYSMFDGQDTMTEVKIVFQPITVLDMELTIAPDAIMTTKVLRTAADHPNKPDDPNNKSEKQCKTEVGGGDKPDDGKEKNEGGGDKPDDGKEKNEGGGGEPGDDKEKNEGGGDEPGDDKEKNEGGGDKPDKEKAAASGDKGTEDWSETDIVNHTNLVRSALSQMKFGIPLEDPNKFMALSQIMKLQEELRSLSYKDEMEKNGTEWSAQRSMIQQLMGSVKKSGKDLQKVIKERTTKAATVKKKEEVAAAAALLKKEEEATRRLRAMKGASIIYLDFAACGHSPIRVFNSFAEVDAAGGQIFDGPFKITSSSEVTALFETKKAHVTAWRGAFPNSKEVTDNKAQQLMAAMVPDHGPADFCAVFDFLMKDVMLSQFATGVTSKLKQQISSPQWLGLMNGMVREGHEPHMLGSFKIVSSGTFKVFLAPALDLAKQPNASIAELPRFFLTATEEMLKSWSSNGCICWHGTVSKNEVLYTPPGWCVVTHVGGPENVGAVKMACMPFSMDLPKALLDTLKPVGLTREFLSSIADIFTVLQREGKEPSKRRRTASS